MGGSSNPPSEYRTARIASALLLIALVVALGLLDGFRSDFDLNPLVLLALLAAAVGLLGVDLPYFRRNGGG